MVVAPKETDRLVYRTDVMVGGYVIALVLLGIVALRDGSQQITDYVVAHPFESIAFLFFPRLFATSVEQVKNLLRGEPMFVKDIKWLSDSTTYNLYAVIYPAFVLFCLWLVWQALVGAF